MTNVFYTIGKYSASNPWMPCIMSVFITLLFATGIYNLHLETDPISLWVSPDSRSYSEQMTFSDSFGPFYRINQFMLLYRDGSEENIFQKEALHVVYYIQQIINNHNYTQNGQQITWDSLCFKPINGKGCLAPSPMDFWLQDLKLLDRTTLCIEPVDPQSTKMICADSNGIPVTREAVFGGITCEEKQDDTQPCDHCWIQAKTLQVTYLLNNDKFTASNAMIWEKEVFEDAIINFNNANFDYLDKLLPPQNELIDHAILKKYRMVYMSERSVPDQITDETNQNAWIVILSYLLMFIYISLAIARFPSKIESGFLLGIGGIYIVIVSMVSSIGFVSYLNMGMTMISLEVIPFLLLAIGVDNMFLISSTFNRIKNAKNLPDKFGKALKDVGPSITTAALCESLAFLMGSMTKMPALQSFCIQAAFGVFIDYLLQITTFVAFLSWDQNRRNKGRFDCLFCIKEESHQILGERDLVKKFMTKSYVPLFSKLYFQLATYFIFVGLFILSVFGCLNLKVGLNEQVSFSEGSDIFNYLSYEARYIAAGPPAYLVLKNLDYTDPKDLQLATDLGNSLSQLNDTVQPPVYSWVSTFKLFISPGQDWERACNTQDILSYTFGEQLKRFLDVQIESDCCQSYGICGQPFQMDIVTDDNYNVLVSRLRFQHRPIHDSTGYILSFQQTRQTVDKLIAGKLTENKVIYPYSLFYMFYDQYSYIRIRAVALNNVLLAIATTFILIAFIQDSWTALISVISVFLVGFNLVGMVWACNKIFGGFQVALYLFNQQIEINAISVVNLVTCLGLSVEFCVHIVIKFMNTKGTRQERIKSAVINVGSSVFIGIITTKFIGVVVLGFAPSNLFKLYYFRMYIIMVFLGAFNGLVLLPVTLNLIGPNFNKIKILKNNCSESNYEPIKKTQE